MEDFTKAKENITKKNVSHQDSIELVDLSEFIFFDISIKIRTSKKYGSLNRRHKNDGSYTVNYLSLVCLLLSNVN